MVGEKKTTQGAYGDIMTDVIRRGGIGSDTPPVGAKEWRCYFVVFGLLWPENNHGTAYLGSSTASSHFGQN